MSYVDAMKPGNPANPFAGLPRQISVQARVKSVSLIDSAQAMVRFDLVQRSDAGGESQTAPYLAVIRYRFRDRPLAEADRFINPLGFEVQRYRRDPEVATADIAPAAAAQAPRLSAGGRADQIPADGGQQ